jgi:hypothetical protein
MSKKKSPEKKLLLEWKRHLADSRLTPEQQNKRAKEFTRKGMKVPYD